MVWLAHPAPGPGGVAASIDWGMFSPTRLSGPGVGAVLAIAVLGFVGFETTTVFAEETRDPRRTIPAATYTAVGVIAVLYGVSAFAMATATGPARIADRSRTSGPDLPFVLAGEHLAPSLMTIGHVLFATSALAASTSGSRASGQVRREPPREGRCAGRGVGRRPVDT